MKLKSIEELERPIKEKDVIKEMVNDLKIAGLRHGGNPKTTHEWLEHLYSVYKFIVQIHNDPRINDNDYQKISRMQDILKRDLGLEPERVQDKKNNLILNNLFKKVPKKPYAYIDESNLKELVENAVKAKIAEMRENQTVLSDSGCLSQQTFFQHDFSTNPVAVLFDIDEVGKFVYDKRVGYSATLTGKSKGKTGRFLSELFNKGVTVYLSGKEIDSYFETRGEDARVLDHGFLYLPSYSKGGEALLENGDISVNQGEILVVGGPGSDWTKNVNTRHHLDGLNTDEDVFYEIKSLVFTEKETSFDSLDFNPLEEEISSSEEESQKGAPSIDSNYYGYYC